MATTIVKWGVYYAPTKQGRIFLNLKDELIESFESQDRAIDFCDNCNMTGYLDELHKGYIVKPIHPEQVN